MKLASQIVRYILIALVTSGIAFFIWLQGQYVTPILMYHHVKARPIKELNTVTPKVFEKQMSFLKRYGHKVLSLDEYIDIKKNGGKDPRGSIVITFDDGYENNYLYAFPVLKQYHYPATIFVVSDMVGKDRFLTWNQIKEMQK